MIRFALLGCIAACGFNPTTLSPGDGGADGARGDAAGDGRDAAHAIDAAPDARECFGTGLATICLTAPVPAQLHVATPTTIDTGVDANCTLVVPQTSGATMCVLAADAIAVDAPLTGIGTRPLVLLATGSLAVTAPIDVSSHVGGATGAGANASECVAPNQPEGDTGGGGGGAGGSFGGKGGDGGLGDGNMNGGFDGTASPGIATATQVPTRVRGGCKGGISGSNDPSNPAGNLGGDSGGALYLIAGVSMTVVAPIYASGAGGPASDDEFGGAGGGTGGLVGFDSPQIEIDVPIIANGAGGAEGGTIGFDGGGGNAGGDGTQSTTTAAAGGTGGTTDAGDGGAGTAGAVLDGSVGHVFFGGGGGGGGGAGYIYVTGTPVGTGVYSPPASVH